MRALDGRRAVVAAEARLLATQLQHRTDTRWLVQTLQRNRSGIAIGAGVISGMIVGWLPLRALLSTGMAMVSIGTALARTPLGPVALGALFARRRETRDDELPSD